MLCDERGRPRRWGLAFLGWDQYFSESRTHWCYELDLVNTRRLIPLLLDRIEDRPPLVLHAHQSAFSTVFAVYEFDQFDELLFSDLVDEQVMDRV